MEFRKTTKSDDLAGLREIFSEGGPFEQFGNILQVNLILDANTVLSDIQWLSAKAKSNEVRTSLLESIDSSVVNAFAPTFLVEEVLKHIPKISQETGSDESSLLLHWEKYREKIIFIDTGGPAPSDIDPKDMPYVRLQELTGYPIATRDKDIALMGAKAVKVEISTLTRDYSRNAAIQYKIAATGIGTLYITEGLIRAAVGLIKSLVNNISRIPAWAWMLLIGGCIWAWSNISIRTWLLQAFEILPENSQIFGKIFIDEISQIFLEHSNYVLESERLRKRLSSELGK